MPSERLEKVAEAIKQEVAVILQRQLKDPRVGFVTVTKVRVSADLQHATVYFSLLEGHGNPSETEAGLKSASGYIRRLVGDRLRLRVTPEIVFHSDSTVADSFRISRLLDSLKKPGPAACRQDPWQEFRDDF